MPRNGSGIYSLPGTYQAVSGETIEAQQHNDPLEDLQSDANSPRPIVAGGTGANTPSEARTKLAVPGLADNNTFTGSQTISGAITSSGINTFSKIQKWAKGADVASANALTLGDDGNYFDITGTTAITSIATKGVGTVVNLHFDGALTLTHHATDLILPGGSDITTAAGDEAEFVEYAPGDWRCVGYQFAVNPDVGKVDWFARSTAPQGWLKADGSTVSRTTYANLFSVIGTTFGAGDGSTTFKLPDLRGEFVRGYDDGRGVDSGRSFGSSQSAAIGPHSHDSGAILNRNLGSGANDTALVTNGNATQTNAVLQSGLGIGTETRPRNIALLACIKYW